MLAKIAAQYNFALRKLGQRLNIPVIDLEQWSKIELQPRDQYFFDSVHLYEEGQVRIGRYLAQEITPLVKSAAAGNPERSRH